jgi:hypothetical protein
MLERENAAQEVKGSSDASFVQADLKSKRRTETIRNLVGVDFFSSLCSSVDSWDNEHEKDETGAECLTEHQLSISKASFLFACKFVMEKSADQWSCLAVLCSCQCHAVESQQNQVHTDRKDHPSALFSDSNL